MKAVGVLALQGGYEAHARALAILGVQAVLVRKPAELQQVCALILPGGESTALLNLMAPWNFLEALRVFHQEGNFLFGTCAGCILLATHVDPEQPSLGLIDIKVQRNAYGRQIDSFSTLLPSAKTNFKTPNIEAVFIRAPKIIAWGTQVKPLLFHGADLVMAEQERVLVATFHPELTTQTTVHQYLLDRLKT